MPNKKLPLYTILDAQKADKTYQISSKIEYPFLDFTEEQEIRFYQGDIVIDGDLCSEEGTDFNPYHILVDGNLTVIGDINWCDCEQGSFLFITGNVKAKNVILQRCSYLVVQGNLTVENGILGYNGDDGGVLSVDGDTQAKWILNLSYFHMKFMIHPKALMIGDEDRTNCPVDFSDEELDDILLPDLLTDGSFDERKISKALTKGKPVLRPNIKPRSLLAQEMIERLLLQRADVTEIDLSNQKLHTFPVALFQFPHLQKLSLAENKIKKIPPDIDQLSSLIELNLSQMDLTELPKELGRLPHLQVLDISDNLFHEIPKELGMLTSLRVLRANDLFCNFPDSLENLSQLEELSLSGFKIHNDDDDDFDDDDFDDDDSDDDDSDDDDSDDDDEPAPLIDLPSFLFQRKNLKKLDISRILLRSLPKELEKLVKLEELSLQGSMDYLEMLPNLSRLASLRCLRFSGQGNDHFPSHLLLQMLWDFEFPVLEELDISSFGKRTGYNERKQKQESRPALKLLPEHAFAKMPALQILDLSDNELTKLPASFYQLQNLKKVYVRNTKLNRKTVETLQKKYSQVQIDFRGVKTRFNVNDPNWKEVHQWVKAGAEKLSSDRKKAISYFKKALALCQPGTSYSDYDQLYALYGYVDALGHLILQSSEKIKEQQINEIKEFSRKALSLVPEPSEIWHFTDEGAFQEEVTRKAGNALAWYLMEGGEYEEALAVVQRALVFAEGDEYDFIRDTQVRILLKMNQIDQAYRIVEQVLTQNPDFADFQDLKHNMMPNR